MTRKSLIPQSEVFWLFFALAVVWVALFYQLGRLPLLQPDEGRNAEVAREMAASGAWLSPSYDGVAYLDKPAFYFKCVALSLAAFGDNETAARLPSALFGLATLALAWAFCRRVHGARCALLAVAIIASLPLFVINSRTVIFDIALALFVSAAIFAGFLAEEAAGKARRNWYLLGTLAAGLATLVKGPVGFIIPVLVLLVFNFIEGRRDAWKRLFAPLNVLLFFAVTLPWFIGLSRQHPDFPYYGLVEESFHRFTTVKFHRTQPFYFYALIVLGLFLPWSFLLPEAAVAALKNKWFKSPADRLCLVWAVAVIIFFSLSKSKLPGYILSTTLPCGILLARFFEQAIASPESRPARIARRAAVTLAILCALAAGIALFFGTRLPLLGRLAKLSPADTVELGRHLLPAAILLAAFAVLALLARMRRDAALFFVLFTVFPLSLFTFGLGAIQTVFEIKSARQLAQRIPALPPQTELAFWHCFPAGLPFYLERTATVATDTGDELTSNYILFRLKNDTNWPANLFRPDGFVRHLAGRTNAVFLVAHTNERDRLKTEAGIQETNFQQLTPLYIGVLLPAP